MITSLTAANIQSAAAVPARASMVAADGVADGAEASVAQPNDSVDFSLIDTPEKAAAIPILNGVVLSMLYGALTGTPPTSAALNMYFGGTIPATINYAASPGAGVIMRATGNIGQSAFQETWLQQGDGSVLVEGNVGGNGEALRVSTDGQYWRLDGRIGNMEVHQKGFTVLGPNSSDNRYVLDGTLGGMDFHQELYHPANSLASRGYIGSRGIDMDMTSAVQPDGSTKINGQGFVAGSYVAVNGVLNAVPGTAAPGAPAAAPAPAPAAAACAPPPMRPGMMPPPYAYRMPPPGYSPAQYSPWGNPYWNQPYYPPPVILPGRWHSDWRHHGGHRRHGGC